MDNCATLHVCQFFNFFGKITETPNVRVKGVYGTSKAADIGTVKFIIIDKEGGNPEVLLKHIIYLPESPKNLISIYG